MEAVAGGKVAYPNNPEVPPSLTHTLKYLVGSQIVAGLIVPSINVFKFDEEAGSVAPEMLCQATRSIPGSAKVVPLAFFVAKQNVMPELAITTPLLSGAGKLLATA